MSGTQQFSPMHLRQALHTTFTSTDASERAAAENYLKSFAFQNSFLQQSFQIIADSSSPDAWSSQDRLAFSVYLKNIITSWSDEELLKQHAAPIQSLVIDLLYRVVQEIAIRNVVMSIIRRVLMCDANAWPAFPNIIHEMLRTASNDISKMQCALLLMNEYSKQLDLRHTENEVFFVQFEGVLLQLYEYLLSQTQQSHPLPLLNMRYNIVKSLWHMLRSTYAATWGAQGSLDSFKKWMALFQQAYQQDIGLFGDLAPQFDQNHVIWKEKRLTGHILYVILLRSFETRTNKDDMQRKKKRRAKKQVGTAQEQAVSNHFLEQYAVGFLQLYVQVMQRYHQLAPQQVQNIPKRNLSPMLVYMDSSIQDGVIYQQVWLPNIQNFFHHILLPFVIFKREDFQLMMDDPSQFMVVNFEENDDIYSTRVATAQIFYELIGLRTKTVMQPFVQFVEQVMTSPQTGAPHQDGIVFLFIHLKRVLDLDDEQLLQYLHKFTVQYVYKAMVSDEPYLRARANAFLGDYLITCVPEARQRHQAIQLILDSLNHDNIVVKTQAAVAISKLIQHDEICAQLKPLLSQLLQSYLQLLVQVDSSTLVASLSTLVTNFAEEMQPFAVETCSSTVDVFMRLFGQEDDDGLLYDTCLECLRTLYTLLSAVLPDQEGNNAIIFTQLEPKILPLIVEILKDEGMSFLEEGLEILTLYTFCAHSLSENVWKIFPVLMQAYKDLELYDYFGFLLAPLDNYISHGTQTFLAHPEYIKGVFDMIAIYLKDDDAEEKNCQPAAKLLSVLFQNCVGRLDEYLPGSIAMVIHKLKIAETTALRILLVDCLGDFMFYNAPLSLQLMDANKVNVVQLTRNWIQCLDGMTRVYDKRVAAIGMTRMLQTITQGGATQAVVQLAPELVRALVKLLHNIHEHQMRLEEEQLQLEEERKSITEKLQNKDGSYKESIQKLLAGEGDGDDADVDDIRDSITNTQFFKGIMEELKQSQQGAWDDADDDELEDENITTPLDDINEFVLMGGVMRVMSENRGVWDRVMGQLDSQTKEGVRQLMAQAQ